MSAERGFNERVRWKLWWWLTKSRHICPANAHTLLIYGDRRDPRIDDGCRRDCAANGTCWCGRLREPEPAPGEQSA